MTETLQPRPNRARDGYGFGWHPDLPDFRDHVYSPTARTKLPTEIRLDLDAAAPAVYDQGQLGSCTGNGIAAAIEYDLRAQSLADFTPSRLFIYYGERVIEGTVDQDAGAYIRDGIKVAAKLGVPSEATWPYDIAAYATRPTDAAYAEARSTRAISYATVRRTLLRRALSESRPVVFGFTVYSSLYQMSAATGWRLPMPSSSDTLEGGHCTLAMGYRRYGKTWEYRIRNSWGAGWGDAGHFWMPEAYLLSAGLSSDFWTIKAVS